MAVQRPTGKPPALGASGAGQQKRAAEATLLLPTAAVPRDEMPPLRVRFNGKHKQKQGGDIPPCHFLRQLRFPAAPLVQERRPVLRVSFRFGPGYLLSLIQELD
jgi:hypothetical protein